MGWTFRLGETPKSPERTFGFKTGKSLKLIIDHLRMVEINHGEFDPGSERTLAARFKHASRTV